MSEQGPIPGFEPPKSNDPPPAAPPRRKAVGHLIAAIVELVVGPIWIYQGAKGEGFNLTMGFGIVLLIMGARSALLYLKQRRLQKATG
jgi:hypothetical protein